MQERQEEKERKMAKETGEKKRATKVTRVATSLAKRMGAGGLEQVITSGCGDTARAGPSKLLYFLHLLLHLLLTP